MTPRRIRRPRSSTPGGEKARCGLRLSIAPRGSQDVGVSAELRDGSGVPLPGTEHESSALTPYRGRRGNALLIQPIRDCLAGAAMAALGKDACDHRPGFRIACEPRTGPHESESRTADSLSSCSLGSEIRLRFVPVSPRVQAQRTRTACSALRDRSAMWCRNLATPPVLCWNSAFMYIFS
jgi:hypothetical protein